MEEKTSGTRVQWQERPARPIAVRPMSAEEIEEHRRNLVASYQCNDEDIVFNFFRIEDELDDDRFDCLLLVFQMKAIWRGQMKNREVFKLKVPVPEFIQIRADQIKRYRDADGNATVIGKSPTINTAEANPNNNTPRVTNIEIEEIIEPVAAPKPPRPNLIPPRRH